MTNDLWKLAEHHQTIWYLVDNNDDDDDNDDGGDGDDDNDDDGDDGVDVNAQRPVSPYALMSGGALNLKLLRKQALPVHSTCNC